MSLTAPRRILLGLIGAGIGRSLTPAMHEREAAANGMHCLYQLLDLDRLGLKVEQLPELLDAAELLGFSGLNITYPAKQHVIPLLDELCDDARAIGAVNTVVFKDGRRASATRVPEGVQGRQAYRLQHRLVGLCRKLQGQPAGRGDG